MATLPKPESGRARAGAIFRRILVPTDLTDRTVKAQDLAVQLAAGGPSRITLLHVVETVPGLGFGELRSFYQKLEAKAEEKMAALARRVATKEIAVKAEVAYGPRAETIIKVATARHADLIVLASHRVNPSMVGRDWGTISYKVGILAQCPVLLVK
jgi:nucleotide-binding universal stress UspA family protein